MQPGDLFLWENTILRNIYRAPWAKRHRSTAPAVWSTGDVCWKHRRNEHRRRFFKNENCRLRHGSTTQQSTQNLCMVYVCVWVWFEVWNVKCNVSDTLNVPPQSQFEMTPSVVAEYRRGGCVWLWIGFLTLRLIKSRPRPWGKAGADTVWRLCSAVK